MLDAPYIPTPPDLSSVSLHQVVLPFYDLIDEEAGYQFGLPPQTGGVGLRAALSERAGVSVLKLFKNGKTEFDPHPIMQNPFEESQGRVTNPPIPQWAWVPQRVVNDYGDEVTRHARVVAPKRNWGCVPLQGLTARSRGRVFYTRLGLQMYNEEQTLFDAPFDIELDVRLEDRKGVEVTLMLCGVELARLGVMGGQLLYVQPSEFSIEHSLWTCHLLRAALVTYPVV